MTCTRVITQKSDARHAINGSGVAARVEGENHVVPRARISFNPHCILSEGASSPAYVRIAHAHTSDAHAVPSSRIIIQSRDRERDRFAQMVVQGLGEATA